MEPKVTLLTWTNYPIETVYSVWEASKMEAKLRTPKQISEQVPKEGLMDIFTKVIAQKIPVGEHIDFVFMLEGISVSLREQIVRHRIGTLPSPERIGADITMDRIPDLANSSWWSQCFVGNTKIRLLDGRNVRIKDLIGVKEFWVYSCDGENIRPGRGHSARETGIKDIVEVELDNGCVERCTSDHLWMKRDGNYVEASKLERGDSLMPLYTGTDKYGYEIIRRLDGSGCDYTHRVVYESVNGMLGDDLVIHHSSMDKKNNDPRFLVAMGKQEHFDFHAEFILKRMKSDPKAHSKALSKGQLKRWNRMNEAERDEVRARLAKARENIDVDKRNKASSEMMKRKWKDEYWKEKMLIKLKENGVKTLGRKQSEEEKARRSKSARERYRKQLENGTIPSGFNHKVVSVKSVGREMVYDITVDKYNNFSLSSGVIVHNSMRIQDMGSFATERKYRIPDSLLDENGNDRIIPYGFGEMTGDSASMHYGAVMHHIELVYKALVAAGVPMEDAREIIPLGAQHRISWKLNMSALQHIVEERGCWILQLGIWEPVIVGMINELSNKIHPVFSELVSPPCMEKDTYTGCVYQEECKRRLDGKDKLPPCPIHLYHEIQPEVPSDIPMYEEMETRAQEYQKFWKRDPYRGNRLKTIEKTGIVWLDNGNASPL
jgi:thymidylate synthase ThyX